MTTQLPPEIEAAIGALRAAAYFHGVADERDASEHAIDAEGRRMAAADAKLRALIASLVADGERLDALPALLYEDDATGFLQINRQRDGSVRYFAFADGAWARYETLRAAIDAAVSAANPTPEGQR